MRTHTLIALLALFLSACASREDISSSQQKNLSQQQAHYRNTEAGGSRIR